MTVGVSSWREVTIASGASLSDALDMRGFRVIALRQPASCEGAVFTFQGSYDGGATFEDIQTEAAELSITKSATLAQLLILKQDFCIFGPTHLKVRTGTSAGPTVQVTTAVVVSVCLQDVGIDS